MGKARSATTGILLSPVISRQSSALRSVQMDLEKMCILYLLSASPSCDGCLLQGYEGDRAISDSWNKIFGNQCASVFSSAAISQCRPPHIYFNARFLQREHGDPTVHG